MKKEKESKTLKIVIKDTFVQAKDQAGPVRLLYTSKKLKVFSRLIGKEASHTEQAQNDLQ